MGSGRRKGYQHPEMRLLMETLVGELIGDENLSKSSAAVQTPQTDVYETASEIIVVVDLPGTNKEQVDCYIQHGKLWIDAVKREIKSPINPKYHCIERLFGKFQRVIEIPTTVNTGKVEAVMNNGVLTVRMLKIEDRRGIKKPIEIK